MSIGKRIPLLALVALPLCGQWTRTLPQEILATSGLIAYWRMGQSSGDLTDSGPNGCTATAHGSPTYSATGAVQGDSDKAVQFTQAGTPYFSVDGAACNTALNFSITTAFSIEAWVKPVTQSGNVQQTIAGNVPNDGVYSGWQFYLLNGSPRRLEFYFATDATHGIIVATPFNTFNDVVSGTYTHVALTYDGSRTAAGVKFYVNGSLWPSSAITQNNAGASGGTSSHHVDIGALSAFSRWTNNTIDELAIYTGILPGTTITRHAAMAVSYPSQFATGGSQKIIIIGETGLDWDQILYIQWAEALRQQGVVDVLAYVIDTNCDKCAAATDVMVQSIRGPGSTVRIGAYHGASSSTSDLYGSAVVSHYPEFTTLGGRANYEDCRKTLREVLNAQASGTVGIVLNSPFQCINDFLATGSNWNSDGIASTGVQLAAKAKWWTPLGGCFQGSPTADPDYNFSQNDSATATIASLVAWPSTVPIYWVGIELAASCFQESSSHASEWNIRIGSDTSSLPPILGYAYTQFAATRGAGWVPGDPGYGIPTWLFSSGNRATFYGLTGPGSAVVTAPGTNSWSATPSNQYYLTAASVGSPASVGSQYIWSKYWADQMTYMIVPPLGTMTPMIGAQ